MKSSDYWKKRAEKRMDYAILKADDISRKIGTAYRQALQEIQEQIESIFRNFAEGISEAEAKRILQNIKSKDILERLKKSVDKIEDENQKAKILAQIKAPAYRARLNRLKQLTENAKQTCEKIAGQTALLTDDCLSDVINDTYYRSIFDMQQETGLAFNFSKISENTVKEILRTNWSGSHYSKRIWDNTDKLSENLENELLKGVLTGKSSGRMSNSLQEIMRSSYNKTLTLVRTEASYVTNQAEKESYKEAKIERYRYVATLDSRTSDICRNLDGKEFDVNKAQVGENYPPMHPRCRSTTIAVIDDEAQSNLIRRAKNPQTNQTEFVPADMTYKEWRKNSLTHKSKSGIIKKSDKFKIPPSKINEFFLKPNAKHSQEFFDVGYTTNDYNLLFDDIEKGFDITKAVDERKNDDGTIFSIFMTLGKTKRKRFRTVWKKDSSDDKPRIITAHREDE